jgi:dolichol-phosphate mannosyltransferase
MITKIIKDNKKTFFPYLAISAFATSIDYLVLYLLTSFIGIFYLISSIISYCIGTTINYILNKRFNFKFTNKPVLKEFSTFMIINLLGLVLNSILMYFFVAFADLNYLIAKTISVFIVFFWNYIGNRYISFNQ